jgi:hypothetical protein
VRLDAVADDGSTFAGWSGAGCEGTGPCRLTVGDDVAVTALFTADPVPPGGTSCTVTMSENRQVTARFFFPVG